MRTRYVMVGLVFGAAVGLGACGDATGPVGAPADVFGCYGISAGPWSKSGFSLAPPKVIALLDSTGTAFPFEDRYIAIVRPEGFPAPFHIATWERMESRYLIINLTPGGEAGAVMHLLWDPFDARWRGTIEVHDDVAPGLVAAATVSMRGRSCPG